MIFFFFGRTLNT